MASANVTVPLCSMACFSVQPSFRRVAKKNFEAVTCAAGTELSEASAMISAW